VFINYLTLILITVASGIALLAQFVWKGLENESARRAFAPAFGGVGLLTFLLGLSMSLNWPLPGNHNIMYGEPTTLFGLIFLMTGIALSQDWDLVPASTLAFFAGIYSLFVGANILLAPTGQVLPATGIGFILAGLGGLFSTPYLMFFHTNEKIRRVAVAFLLVTMAVWMVMFVASLWVHLQMYQSWVPVGL
jgi:putative membrane protein